MNVFPPRPQFLTNLGADYLCEEHLGVKVEYWGSDESVKAQLSPEEWVTLHSLPDKAGARTDFDGKVYKAAIFFNTPDPAGQYSLWKVTADFMTIREKSLAGIYILKLIDCITRILEGGVGENKIRNPLFKEN